MLPQLSGACACLFVAFQMNNPGSLTLLPSTIRAVGVFCIIPALVRAHQLPPRASLNRSWRIFAGFCLFLAIILTAWDTLGAIDGYGYGAWYATRSW